MNRTLFILFNIFFSPHYNSLPISAQIIPDFKVNDDITNNPNQVGKVDYDSSGNFVIVWQDKRFSTQEIPNITVFAQRYHSNGLKIGVNFKVSDVVDTAQLPNICVKLNGEFIVCWTDRSNSRIVARTFHNDGTPSSQVFLVSDSNYSNVSPSVETDSKQNFTIVWENYTSGESEKVYFQRFDSVGSKIGGNKNVSDNNVSSRKSNPDIAVRKDGSYIVCWQDNRLDAGTYDIYMQMYDTTGEKIRSNIRVNEITTLSQELPKIVSDTSGNFCIAWTDLRLYPNILAVCQFYDAAGEKIGNNFLIAVNTSVPVLSSRENGDIAAGIYEAYPKLQRIRSDRTLWGASYMISIEALSSTKYITDIKIYKDRIINVWQDNRNGHSDIYCNIRSYNNPDSVTSIIQISNEIPDEFKLLQNYPNPFNPGTRIPFEISKSGHIKLIVFDMLGREIKTLLNKKLQAGKYEVNFESENLPSGVYYYELQSPHFSDIRKMIVVK